MSPAGTTLDSDKEAGVAGMVWDVLLDVVSARMAETGRQALDLVDRGGGHGRAGGMVCDVLLDVVSARMTETGRQALDIVDVGGGTGGLAVPFAALGHNVTVVDPSPDALAADQPPPAPAGARPGA